MRILVIEDSRILQAGIKRALTKAGYEVILARDGQEGLDTASKVHPDLVLLDMMLPTMMGMDVLRALKSQPATKDIAIFVLTGLSQKNEDKLLHAGATRYFEKSDLLLGQNFASLIQAIEGLEPLCKDGTQIAP
jgi:DNA-binding response OmpR family regulator